MFKMRFNKKGIMLFIVLGTLLVVMTFASIILSLILSHARLTHHQTSRIQAHYAAMAGINYALEKLRLGNDPNWQAGTYTHKLCRSGCAEAGDINDSDLPSSIQRVEITVGLPVANGTRPISAKAIYTYTAS